MSNNNFLFTILVLVSFGWPALSPAASSCANAYEANSATYANLSSEQMTEIQSLKEAQETQIAETVSGFIEKFDQSLPTPGGMSEVSNQLFSFTEQWLRKSGEVIQLQTANFSKTKSDQLAQKLGSQASSSQKNLIKLAELVARNKSLKVKILNWMPKYADRKIEKISEQIRWGGHDLQNLLKQIDDENSRFNTLAKEISAEAQKITAAHAVILKLREHYQQKLWDTQQNGDTTSDYAINTKQMMVHLEKELNNLMSLQVITTTLGESIRAHLAWNNTTQLNAREVLLSSPVTISSVSDRALNLNPQKRDDIAVNRAAAQNELAFADKVIKGTIATMIAAAFASQIAIVATRPSLIDTTYSTPSAKIEQVQKKIEPQIKLEPAQAKWGLSAAELQRINEIKAHHGLYIR